MLQSDNNYASVSQKPGVNDCILVDLLDALQGLHEPGTVVQ